MDNTLEVSGKMLHEVKLFLRSNTIIAPNEGLVDAATRAEYAMRCSTTSPLRCESYAHDDYMRMQRLTARRIISVYLSANKSVNPVEVRVPVPLSTDVYYELRKVAEGQETTVEDLLRRIVNKEAMRLIHG